MNPLISIELPFLVKAREPFIAWLKQVDGSISLDTELLESTIYLMEVKENEKESETWIKDNFEQLFVKQLEEWYLDKSIWPQNRTYTIFREWFDISFHSMVYDLKDYPVEKDLF